MPGFRNIRPGDVAVFNYPFGRGNNKIEFKINYVYTKRCIGCPGDSVSIVNGYYYNNRMSGIIGEIENQNILSSTQDDELTKMGVVLEACPYVPENSWTIKNYGPMYIPAKGETIQIDTISAKFYAAQIEYETGSFPEFKGPQVYIAGVPYSGKFRWDRFLKSI